MDSGRWHRHIYMPRKLKHFGLQPPFQHPALGNQIHALMQSELAKAELYLYHAGANKDRDRTAHWLEGIPSRCAVS